MYISSVFLTDYRNYANQRCSFYPGVNLLIGANAQGKTNLIEAIHYLSIGRAYRLVGDEQLIRWGTAAFTIGAQVENRSGKTEMEICYTREGKPGKTMTAGGLRRSRWEDVSGLLTSVLFSPDSMVIVKGAPQDRRGFLDRDIGQISGTYNEDLLRYRKILLQRNTLLKMLGGASFSVGEKKERLSIWDRQLMLYGSRITAKRLSFMSRMAPMARLTHRRLTRGREDLDLRYRFGYAQDAKIGSDDTYQSIYDLLENASQSLLARDLQYRSTQWGPHRDDVDILVNGRDIRKYGSQGQQRTGVLALKLAEIEVFRGESGEYPILLLDDVLSELDPERQRQLLGYINAKHMQCIVTATGLRDLSLPPDKTVNVFRVSGGQICEEQGFHV